jgi:hypothetical protein
MAERRMILGQVNPQAAADTLLYSATSETVVSTIFACTCGTAAAVRIWVRRKGEATATKQYVYYSESLIHPETMAVTAGITLDVGDDIMVRSSVGDTAFSAFGTVRE